LPKKTFECAEHAGAILITQAKKNQKTLLNQLSHGSNIQKPIDIFEEKIDKIHGRIEKRKYEVYPSSPMLNKWKREWPYIRSVIKVTRQRGDSTTVRFYVSNGEKSAKEFGKHIRQHWYIENKLHYIKDAVFHEDRCRKRVNPGIFSSFIDWTINLLRTKGVTNIKRELYNNAMNLDASIEYIT
jgi:predicted transposase YbfD/YdcC